MLATRVLPTRYLWKTKPVGGRMRTLLGEALLPPCTHLTTLPKSNIADEIGPGTVAARGLHFNDMIAIHLFETSCNQKITVVDDRLTRNTRQLKQLSVKRTWSTRINLLQTEDCSGYGTQFRPTPKFAINHTPTALTWALFGILSSCPALWHAVDGKRTAFRCSRWEGWLLTSVQTNCFQFDTIHVPRQSPFKRIPVVSKLFLLVNACLCLSEDETASDGDSLEAELTAREESSSNGATLSMDD